MRIHAYKGDERMDLVKEHSRAFKLGIGLNLAFIICEAGFGLSSQSLALVADAGHNLSDVLGLVISWAALLLGQRQATCHRTYGYKSISIFAALLNAILLIVAVVLIIVEALQRLREPAPTGGSTVIVVALIGIFINGGTALLFMHGQHDLNIKSAFMHMAADAIVSVGVVIAGFLILLTGWNWLDPVVSLVIAAVILVGTIGLLRDSWELASGAVPAKIDVNEVRATLCAHPEVNSVHDLHIWAIGTSDIALTAHLCRYDFSNNNYLIKIINDEMKAKYGITHVTIQVEQGKLVPELTDHNV